MYLFDKIFVILPLLNGFWMCFSRNVQFKFIAQSIKLYNFF